MGRLREPFYKDACAEYVKRMVSSFPVEIIELTEERVPENPSDKEIDAALAKEAEAIDRALGRVPGRTIALCVEGEQKDSPAFAKMLEDARNTGCGEITFIIGGSFGLHESVKAAADFRISLSRMTFPHHLARVILLEQLYRACNRIAGGKYAFK